MKTTRLWMLAAALLCSLTTLTFESCLGTDDNPAAAPATAYSASTQELIQLVEANPQLKQLLQEAIAKGKELNPDKKTNPAQSLSEYFINDIPLDELDGQSLYNNSLQYFEPYRTWLKSFAKAWGQYLDSKESWNQAYYEIVAKEDTFGISKTQPSWCRQPTPVRRVFGRLMTRAISFRATSQVCR